MYLTILDYTNGKTIMINAPVFDDEEDYSEKVEEFIKETYGNITFHWIANESLEIDI